MAHDIVLRNPGGSFSISLSSSTTSDYEYSASGGIVASGIGTSSFTRSFSYQGAGESVLSGSGSCLYSRVFEFIGVGTCSLSGATACSYTRTYSYSPSGGVLSSGSALFTIDVVVSLSGGALLSGSSALQIEYSFSSTGGLTSAGSASCSWEIAFIYSGSGGCTLSGILAAYYIPIHVVSGSGAIALQGLALSFWNALYLFSSGGSVVMGGGGLSSYTRTFSFSPGGSMYAGGAASISLVFQDEGSGGIALSGSASIIVLYTHLAVLPSGTVLLAGMATCQLQSVYVYQGLGEFVLSGVSPSALDIMYLAEILVLSEPLHGMCIDYLHEGEILLEVLPLHVPTLEYLFISEIDVECSLLCDSESPQAGIFDHGDGLTVGVVRSHHTTRYSLLSIDLFSEDDLFENSSHDWRASVAYVYEGLSRKSLESPVGVLSDYPVFAWNEIGMFSRGPRDIIVFVSGDYVRSVEFLTTYPLGIVRFG